MTGLLGDALALATLAHRNQLYGDQPYITHPIAVATLVAAEGADQEIVAAALLHDTVEDCHWVTLDLLHRYGFPARTIRCVDGVTRRPREVYMDFVRRAAAEDDSRLVKLADNTHNLGGLSPRDARGDRYTRARLILVAANDGGDPWVTSVPDYTLFGRG